GPLRPGVTFGALRPGGAVLAGGSLRPSGAVIAIAASGSLRTGGPGVAFRTLRPGRTGRAAVPGRPLRAGGACLTVLVPLHLLLELRAVAHQVLLRQRRVDQTDRADVLEHAGGECVAAVPHRRP